MKIPSILCNKFHQKIYQLNTQIVPCLIAHRLSTPLNVITVPASVFFPLHLILSDCEIDHCPWICPGYLPTSYCLKSWANIMINNSYNVLLTKLREVELTTVHEICEMHKQCITFQEIYNLGVQFAYQFEAY